MIGVKPKKKKVTNSPGFDIAEGQAVIYGKVTERNVFDNSVNDAIGVQVTLYKNGVLIVFTATSNQGEYIMESIDAGSGYTLEFISNTGYVTPIFSVASKEAKEVNVELTTQ